MSLRTRRAMGLLATAAIFVAACGSATSPSPSTSAAPSGAASQPPASAAPSSADFRFAVDGEPTYFSPASNDLPSANVNAFIYTGLFRVNNKGDVVPDIATEMPEVSADGLVFTIKIRPDVKWHDDSPLTSADVKFTYELAMSPKCSFNATTCSTFQENVATVEAPTPDSLVMTLKRKYAAIYIFGLTQQLVPKAATEASYQEFVAGSGTVDAAAVTALYDKIVAATNPESATCAVETPPDTCSAAFYTADMEALLTSAGVTLPDKAKYVDAENNFDPKAYGDALFTQVGDLNTTLQAGETDKLAAAYRLLDINLSPIGSGAYKFVKYTPGQSVELARWDGYYLFVPGPAKLLVPVIKDAAAASQALQSGNIDWQTEVTSSDALASLKSDPNIKLSEFPDLGYYFLAFNVREGRVFSDVIARQALSMCIDQETTVKAATESNGIPVKANVPPGSYFYNPDVPDYKYDVAGAKALLESNGYTLTDGVYAKAGNKLKADLYVRQGRPQRVNFAQLAKDQLIQCGIDLTVKEADFSTVLLPKLDYPNDFDIYLGGWANLTDPEDSNIFGCAHVTTKENPADNNFPGFCDAKVDELQKAAAEELDRAKRKEILAELQVYLHDNGPYYFLWADLGHRGYSAKVEANGVLGPIDYTSFYDTWNQDSWIVKQ